MAQLQTLTRPALFPAEGAPRTMAEPSDTIEAALRIPMRQGQSARSGQAAMSAA